MVMHMLPYSTFFVEGNSVLRSTFRKYRKLFICFMQEKHIHFLFSYFGVNEREVHKVYLQSWIYLKNGFEITSLSQGAPPQKKKAPKSKFTSFYS